MTLLLQSMKCEQITDIPHSSSCTLIIISENWLDDHDLNSYALSSLVSVTKLALCKQDGIQNRRI